MASNQTQADRTANTATPNASTAQTPAQKDAAARAYWQQVYNQQHPPDTSGLTGVSAAAAQYPAFAALTAIPEVANLLNQASLEGWSNDQLTVHLMATNWWKSKSDTERVWEATKLSDPAKAAQTKSQMAQQVNDEAGKLGVNLDPNQVMFIAEGAVGQGWNASQLQQAIAGNAQINKDRPGQIQSTQTQFATVAAQYGIPISPHTTFDWAKRVAEGTADPSGFTEYARQQAKISHPYWSTQLDQGLTVRQLADPYLQQAARLLEISPDTVNLSDPKWNFTTSDAKGTQVPMNQLDWSKKLMTDPAYGWDKTGNAKDAAFQIQAQLREAFGAS